MPLMPMRVKHRKQQRGNRAGTAWRGASVSFGDYGLQALERDWITATQIEACRVTLSRHMKRRGKLWIRIFPDKPISGRPPETRMGKGKGNVEFWAAVVRPGNVMFEMGGVTEQLARESFRLAAAKLPIKTRFVKRK
ncbi:MAG: 50S ribosomal protein L16 [Verrucomicrobia bacterium]|nr:50S ribosomal protein L16 [Verrucomicrobiota bacterium]